MFAIIREESVCQAEQNVFIGWLLNGTSTQKGQFVPTAGRETGSVG